MDEVGPSFSETESTEVISEIWRDVVAKVWRSVMSPVVNMLPSCVLGGGGIGLCRFLSSTL